MTCVVAGATIAIAGPASADAHPDPYALFTAAQEAAYDANISFVDAQWDDVVDSADAFDELYAALAALRDETASRAAAAQTAYDDAADEHETAVSDRDDARDAVDNARDALEDARRALRDAKDALREAEQALADLPAAIEAAGLVFEGAQSDADAADDDVADAQSAADAAVAAYNASIGSVIGLPSWLTGLNNRPVKVSDVPAAIERANQDFLDAQARVNQARDTYQAATGFGKLAALAFLRIQEGLRDLAQDVVEELTDLYDDIDGPARAQAITDTQGALDSAVEAQAPAHQALADAGSNLEQLQNSTPVLEAAVGDAQDAVEAAEAALDQARLDLDAARAALDTARGVLEQKLTAVAGAAANLSGWLNDLTEIESYLEDLRYAAQSIADRRADLADLDLITRTVVWTLGADNETPRAGDTVKLNFTVPNSDLYDLSDASVRVVSPQGVTPTCDIVDGVVAAGAIVTCTATYVPTDADAKAGEVVFEVELTGYLPLGPGNPRSRAVTRTLFTATQSITVPVAAAVVTDAGGDGELSETGADLAPGALAAALMLAGGALLVVRRRFANSL